MTLEKDTVNMKASVLLCDTELRTIQKRDLIHSLEEQQRASQQVR